VKTLSQILIITGDGGESYEALYAVHRFAEEDWKTAVAAPSRRWLNLVMHDFKPGWDTYIERRGYGLAAELTFEDVRVEEYEAILPLGGRRSICGITPEWSGSYASSIGRTNGFSPSAMECRSWPLPG